MNWIDERIKESEELQERKNLVYQQAESVFNALWKKIEEYINYARNKAMDVGTDGSSGEHVAYISQKRGERRELVIKLSHERGKSSVRSTGAASFTWPIEVLGSSTTAGLVDGSNNHVKEDDAALVLVDRLLFPELPPKIPEPKEEELSEDENASLRRMEHERNS